MVRFMSSVLMTLLFGLVALMPPSALAGHQIKSDPPGMDRPGGDYQHNALDRADPQLCVSQCLFDSRCSSFTYVRPGLQGPKAVCWLKSTPRRTVRSTCCQSGVKSYVADTRPPRPAEIQPPETLNKQWCTLGLICASQKRGTWIDERRTCECDPP